MNKIKQFWQHVQRLRSDPNKKSLREGQIMYIAFGNVDDETTVDGTDFDPFYGDSRIPKFLEFITKKWSEE